MVSAISRGSVGLLMGISASALALSASSPPADMGVFVQLGSTALQRMPCPASSSATDFVSTTMPAFEAEYTADVQVPFLASVLDMLTMAAPPSGNGMPDRSMSRLAVRFTNKVPWIYHMRHPPVTSSAAPVTKELEVGEHRNLMTSAISRG